MSKLARDAGLRERVVVRMERVATRLSNFATNLGEVTEPDRPGSTQPPFQMFGLIAAWYEGDIIADCVTHLFAQGCDRVFLIDNNSPDDTVEKAVGAGAELVAQYQLDEWDQTVSNRIVDHVLKSRSRDAEADHVWWVVADADEFFRGPYERTVRQHVESLPESVRLVGAESLNHVPTTRPAYVAGTDPRITQPMCCRVPQTHCRAGHWKHPVVRVDRGRALPSWTPHQIVAPGVWREAAVPIVINHIQYRDEEQTRTRLKALLQRIPERQARAAKTRAHQLDAVYAGEWESVQLTPTMPAGIEPRPWPDVLDDLGLRHE